ncbi:hypothetical protein NPIL_71701 [Nephila pilipes]|uniref:Uncharacterized protein n=1 Tax=Nephila pilipes TaxID=299642 RepID=A0A8X6TYY8_NEPPI|nr:hypothetical protein NPIL_71701 [Nephila pilipes]
MTLSVSLSPRGSWLISRTCQELAYTTYFSVTPLLAVDLFCGVLIVPMAICHFYAFELLRKFLTEVSEDSCGITKTEEIVPENGGDTYEGMSKWGHTCCAAIDMLRTLNPKGIVFQISNLYGFNKDIFK